MIGSVSGLQPFVQKSDMPAGQEVEQRTQNKDHETEAQGKLAEESTKLKNNANVQLSKQEQLVVAKLQSRDREVRAHESAHIAGAGSVAHSGASFTYTRGPDGRRYAIGGEVSIDTSPVAGDPKASIRKAETIRRAALAPVSPSSQDRTVASNAAAMAAQARVDLVKLENEQKIAEQQGQQTTSNKPSYIIKPTSEAGSMIDTSA